MITSYLDGIGSDRKQHGPWIVSRDPETRSRLFRRTMRQLKDNYVPLTPTASNTISIFGTDAYFYEETQPRDLGAGIIEWDEFYAEMPGGYTEPTLVTHTYQWIVAGVTDTPIYERTISVAAIRVVSFGTVDYDGTHSIGLHIAPKYVYDTFLMVLRKLGEFAYHSPSSTTDILHQDTALTRWHGPIFKKEEIFVPTINPVNVTS